MEVTLDPGDLDPQYQKWIGNKVELKIPISEVTFAKLNKKAQKAVTIAGRGIFYSWDKKTYAVIYPLS